MFTCSDFVKIINVAQNNGYRFLFFHEIKKNRSKVCLLRHDVDNSPEAALELAKLEFKLGVKSTYFFMVVSEVYNILAPGTKEIVNKIKHLGHEIGLHFSEATYGRLADFNRSWPDRLAVCIDAETKIIENLSGKAVKVVSFHQPSRQLIKIRPSLVNKLNVYRPEDTGNAYYISDSNMSWRGKDPLRIFSSREQEKIQLLIHPMWWRKSPGSIRQRWRQALTDRVFTIWKYWQDREGSFESKWPVQKLRSLDRMTKHR